MQLRNVLPKTLFGRMLSIILVPMIFVQVITVFIFYDRHWDTVTRHMANNLSAEISILVDQLGNAPDEELIDTIKKTGWEYFNFPIQFDAETPFAGSNSDNPQSYAEEMLWRALGARLARPWRTNVYSDPHLIYVDVTFDTGTLRI